MGAETTPPLVGHHFQTSRQFSVRSVCWLESPDHWKVANEWVWLRSWTHRKHVNKALTQVSVAKWKYGPKNVSIVWKRLPVKQVNWREMLLSYHGWSWAGLEIAMLAKTNSLANSIVLVLHLIRTESVSSNVLTQSLGIIMCLQIDLDYIRSSKDFLDLRPKTSRDCTESMQLLLLNTQVCS